MRTMFKTSALRPITIIFVALFVLTPFFAWPAGQDPGTEGTLRRDLAAILDEAPLRPAHVGIIVESLATGNRLFEYNGEKRFVPASNMKLFTTAAALLALSPDFRYETRLFTDGMVHSGVLRGNLIIKGSGDPTISGYFNDNNPLYVFEQWASKLKEAGIREVRGNIVIDNSLFSGRPYGAGWLVEDTTNCYSAPKDAFTFNNNCVQLDISPALKPGEHARIVMEPVTRLRQAHQ